MNSIRRTLLLWLTLGITVGIVIAAALVYLQARKQADELFDYQMKQMMASLPVPTVDTTGLLREFATEQQEDIVIQMWNNEGLRIYRSHVNTSLPQRAELGFTNVVTNGETWRVYSVQIGNTIVQAAQPTSARSAVAAQTALQTAVPLLLLLPVLGILIWLTVGSSLGKVIEVASEVAKRGASSLDPISERAIPQEILPLTSSLNGLLSRLRAALETQRTFIADAAHELKTPLTALKLQLQLAERAQTAEERQSAFADLNKGIERTNHLVQQLLTLARQEPGAADFALTELDLAALARQTITEFATVANDRQIDLGFIGAENVMIAGDAAAIHTMLINLIDNALRYSPSHSKVDVNLLIGDREVCLTVSDKGPGIPEVDLQRIFDRFYRVPGSQGAGSGLGLAIVKQVADRQGATIEIVNTNPGLAVSVHFVRYSTLL